MIEAKTKRSNRRLQSLRSGKPGMYYAYTLFDGIECCQSSNGIDTMVGMKEPSETTTKGISQLKSGGYELSQQQDGFLSQLS
jgi:hypothetical protein